MLVVSGLAYGIDILAHREALVNDLPTVVRLPRSGSIIIMSIRKQYDDMLKEKGGLLTEFLSVRIPTNIISSNRNRIVLGMCTRLSLNRRKGARVTAV